MLYYVGHEGTAAGIAIGASASNVPVLQFESLDIPPTSYVAIRSVSLAFHKHASFDWFTHDDAPIKVRMVLLSANNASTGTARTKLDDSISEAPTFLDPGIPSGSSWTGIVDGVYASWYVHPLWTPTWERIWPNHAPIMSTDNSAIGFDITTGSKGVDVLSGSHIEMF